MIRDEIDAFWTEKRSCGRNATPGKNDGIGAFAGLNWGSHGLSEAGKPH
jgi:hypothetical protein